MHISEDVVQVEVRKTGEILENKRIFGIHGFNLVRFLNVRTEVHKYIKSQRVSSEIMINSLNIRSRNETRFLISQSSLCYPAASPVKLEESQRQRWMRNIRQVTDCEENDCSF